MAAASIGVNVWRNRFIAYVAAAAGCGLAGGMSFMAALFITVTTGFDLNWVVAMIFIVIIGGIGTLEGPIVGTVLILRPSRAVHECICTLRQLVPDSAGNRRRRHDADCTSRDLAVRSRQPRDQMVERYASAARGHNRRRSKSKSFEIDSSIIPCLKGAGGIAAATGCFGACLSERSRKVDFRRRQG